MDGALRIDRVPSLTEIAEFYEAISAEPGFQERMYQAPFQRQRFRRLQEILTLVLPFTPYVLEVGCADGKLTRWMAQRAKLITAIDVSPPCIQRCRELELPNVEFVLASIEEYYRIWDRTHQWRKLPQPSRKHPQHDLAVASEVLEHCIDPAAEMERLRIMAWGILVSVPISENPNPDAFSVEAYRNPRKAGDGSGHIWSFRPNTFRTLFEQVWHYEEVMGLSAIILGR